jgi:hypothetical protein
MPARLASYGDSSVEICQHTYRLGNLNIIIVATCRRQTHTAEETELDHANKNIMSGKNWQSECEKYWAARKLLPDGVGLEMNK